MKIAKNPWFLSFFCHFPCVFSMFYTCLKKTQRKSQGTKEKFDKMKERSAKYTRITSKMEEINKNKKNRREMTEK